MVSSRSDEAVPGDLRLLVWLDVKFEGRVALLFPFLVLFVWRAFRRVPASLCTPSNHRQSVPQGHFLKTGGIEKEKHDILENLVNSRLVSSHFSKES